MTFTEALSGLPTTTVEDFSVNSTSTGPIATLDGIPTHTSNVALLLLESSRKFSFLIMPRFKDVVTAPFVAVMSLEQSGHVEEIQGRL